MYRIAARTQANTTARKISGSSGKMSADLMYLDNIREFLEDGDGIVSCGSYFRAGTLTIHSSLATNAAKRRCCRVFLQVTYRWLSHTLSVPCNVAKQCVGSR